MDFDYTRLAAEKYSEVRGKKKGNCILKRFIKIIAALCIFFIVFMIVLENRKSNHVYRMIASMLHVCSFVSGS